MAHEARLPRLWLSEVCLERFKAAFMPEPIELRPHTVLIGRNGSGKSTLLEALQWLDTTIRRDAREASDRYFGIHDLINLRSRVRQPYFQLTLNWEVEPLDDEPQQSLCYTTKVEEADDNTPRIAEELLVCDQEGERHVYVETIGPGRRLITGTDVVVRDPDRLSLGVIGSLTDKSADPLLAALAEFWARAVFLRLSPNRLAESSAASRRSFEPLLDEEGQKLAALLNELDSTERAQLVSTIRRILPDIRDVAVEKAGVEREARVSYSLLERMPYRGRSGRWQLPIPSWMLSEGTRRLTAILALLARQPPPSLLCVEEIENGLDPWTVREVMGLLQAAGAGETQTIVSTHSPWVLDDVPLDSIIQVRRLEGETRYQAFGSREEVQAFGASIPPGTRYIHADEI